MLLLSVLALVLLSSLSTSSAHITFSPNAGAASTTLITALRVPHGCDLVLNSGDAGPKTPTLSITAYVPNALSTLSPLPGYVPNWPLTISTANVVDPLSGGAATSWTWTASDGAGLPLGQFLNFPVSMSLPAVAAGGVTTLQVAVLQQCANITNSWSNTTAGASYPPPHINVTNVSTGGSSSAAYSTASFSMQLLFALTTIVSVVGQLM